ncbi:trypsin-like serine protease [Streptomyces sp. NPDC053792]|uniref:trypsin-like serine protease n=1 Tax=Streptomyces sp. NPDC053792 TaxID=3365716 RepID=UPI0037CE9BC5
MGRLLGVLAGGSAKGLEPSLPEQWQTAQLPVMSRAACQSAYPGVDLDGMLCASAADAGTATICEGDGGGPLVVNGRIVGVASSRDGICDTVNNSPSVFTDVATCNS